MDISTSGAKFRFSENLGQELKRPEMVDACKIGLPDDSALQTGVQLIGMVSDEGANISFLRCQFVHMRSQDEDKLDSFIKNMLRQQDASEASNDV